MVKTLQSDYFTIKMVELANVHAIYSRDLQNMGVRKFDAGRRVRNFVMGKVMKNGYPKFRMA